MAGRNYPRTETARASTLRPVTRSSSRVSSSKAWLIPPIDGTKSIAAGINRATFFASWSAPDGILRQRPGASASDASDSVAIIP